MNKGHFKDSQVVKGITIGAVLIVIYLALNNVTGILDSISYLAGLVMPFIIGAVIAFVFNVPMKAIEKGLKELKEEASQTYKSACLYAYTDFDTGYYCRCTFCGCA